jgi:4-amino-4-deoxy-L-arabinose transferase-like glycosyltransferase
MGDLQAQRPPVWQSTWFQLGLVLVVAGCIYWPMLGSSGFAFSEGQRVFPGWTFADEGDWFIPRLLDQPYLRKPPGMPWAIAASALLFGQSEYSARAVSALAVTLGGVLAFAFARRWFGGPWGLVAGIAYLLTPLYWYPGRSAEIEALHNIFVQLTLLVMLEVLLNRPTGRAAIGWSLTFAAGLAGMAIVKGPAAIPCLIAAGAAACLMRRRPRVLVSPALTWGIVLAGIVVAALAWRIAQRVAELPEAPVVQSAEQFLWKPGRRLEVLVLPASALLAALPWSGALLFAFIKTREPETPELDRGRAVSLTVLLALAIYTVIGVYNNRYTMPMTTLLPVVVAFAGWRIAHSPLPPWASRLATHTLMRRPWVWGLVLLMGALVSLVYTEHRRDVRTSGREAGVRLGEFLPDGAILTGDLLLDHRPEVAWYARQHAAAIGKRITVQWRPAHKHGQGENPIPPPGTYLALLNIPVEIDEAAELDRYKSAGLMPRLERVHLDAAHKFLFEVFRVRPEPDRLVNAALAESQGISQGIP